MDEKMNLLLIQKQKEMVKARLEFYREAEHLTRRNYEIEKNEMIDRLSELIKKEQEFLKKM